MKKLILLALTFAMLLTAVGVLPMSAAADTAVTLPNCVYAQTTAPASNKQDVRFVSEVPVSIVNENVSALGYEVVATFKNAAGDIKVVTYDVEGNTVYSAITATDNGTTNKVEPKEGYYFFALTITDVPTNLGDIFFAVRTYTRVGEKKTYANVKEFTYTNGVVSKKALVYAENFDGGSTGASSADVHTALKWGYGGYTNNNTKATLKYTSDGALQFGNVYGSSCAVDYDAMKNLNKYSVEMDVTLTGVSGSNTVFNVLFNYDGYAKDMGATRKTMGLTLREVNDAGKLSQDSSKIGVSLIKFYKHSSGTNQASLLGTDMYKTTDISYGKTFNLRFDVDNVAKTITICIDDVVVWTYNSADYIAVDKQGVDGQMYTTSGPICFWVEKCTAVIDNLTVVDTTNAN